MATSRSAKRAQIVRLLEDGDIAGAAGLADQTGGIVTILLQLLFDPASQVHWRAIEAVGRIAQSHPKAIEKIIPRLLWSLNEDSASFGWGAAALLGEIGRQNYRLVADIIEMLFQFLEDEFTREGMLWGLGRLGQSHPEIVKGAAPRILACLSDASPQIRAYAAWCLGILGDREVVPALTALVSDAQAVKLYDQGVLQKTTVGQIAHQALQGLQGES
ncbi:MAG: DVU0298 family protein [Desulfobacca sp.]|uniref:DVU0298 family protein n=1 Tax=Desulfobacca sp. TaxID=2067990 RepID=UPI00404B9A9A